ncbi:MAG: hypothetical protein KGY60_12390 [Bacteroidales bacterium]|nr:hypothetical protein [Bacteroidales bacterium]
MNAYEHIEAYIQGDLTEQETREFEHTLDQNQELADEYQLRKDIENALMDDDLMELKSQVQDMMTEKEKDPHPLVWFKRKAVKGALVGALVLSLSSLGYYAAQVSTIPTKEEIFHKYYQPYSVTITDRSGSDEVNTLLTSAMERYKEREYNQALQLFQKVLTKREDVAASLYSGISFMEVQKYKQANESFEDVVEDKDNLYLDQARWYMSMCHIRLGNIEDARNMLFTLAEESEYYRDKARKVERKLRRIQED